MSDLPETGLLRLSQFVPGVLPIAESTWWAGVKSGIYPKPVKLGPRISTWRAEDIRRIAQQGTDDQALEVVNLTAGEGR